MNHKKARGSSLVQVVIISAIALLAALTVGASASFQLQATLKVENQQNARDLADSAIQQTVAELMSSNQYGQVRATRVDVPAASGMPADAHGWVTFDPANSEHDAYSTNNQDGSSGLGWDNRIVPLSQCHLVGIGQSGGVVRRVEVMVHIPQFPRAIASDGPITLNNALVASVTDAGAITYHADGTLALPTSPANLLVRGDIMSNSDVHLINSSHVTGAVDAVGAVTLNNGSAVDGEVASPAAPFTLASIQVTQYDPTTNPNTAYNTLSSGAYSPPAAPLTGTNRFANGDVTVSGDLVLDNAVVYVAGNLTVYGAIKGVGAVFTEGGASVQGGVRLSASDNIALVSMGDVRLRGDGQASSIFQGLVYTRGAFSASLITIVGTFVAEANASGTRGPVSLTDCNCVYIPGTGTPTVYAPTNFVFPETQDSGLQTFQETPASPNNATNVPYASNVTISLNTAALSLWTLPLALPYVIVPRNVGSAAHPVTAQSVQSTGGIVPWIVSGAPPVPLPATPVPAPILAYFPNVARTVQNTLGLDGSDMPRLGGVDDMAVVTVQRTNLTSPPQFNYYYSTWEPGYTGAYTGRRKPDGSPDISVHGPYSLDDLPIQAQAYEDSRLPGWSTWSSPPITPFNSASQARLKALASFATTCTSSNGCNLNLAPNNFLNVGASTRILYRREL